MTRTPRDLDWLAISLACMALTASVCACSDPGADAGCGVDLESAVLAGSPLAATASTGTMQLTLRMSNEAEISVQHRQLAWILEVDGQALSRGTTPQLRPMPPHSTAPLTLNIPLSEKASHWVAAAMNKPHRQVRLKGFCGLKVLGKSKEVAFDAKQDVY